jgi:hypothetical protein
MCNPALTASGCELATIPFRAKTALRESIVLLFAFLRRNPAPEQAFGILVERQTMSKTAIRFTASLVKQGARCWIVLPDEAAQLWGERAHHYLAGEIAGRPFRGRTEQHNHQMILPVGAAWLRDSGIQPAQEVACELCLESPLLEELSDEIREAIQADPQAQAFFEGLAPFYRKNYLRWIESARTPVTRARRIAEMVTCLREGRMQR